MTYVISAISEFVVEERTINGSIQDAINTAYDLEKKHDYCIITIKDKNGVVVWGNS